MSEAKIALSVEDQRLLDKALMRSTQHAYDIPPPPAAMPGHFPDTGKMVPAAMPSEEEIARAIYEALGFAYEGRTVLADGTPYAEWAKAVSGARAVLALFAPILAEKEREKAAALGLVQGHAAVIASLEARALAAEAAERERCAGVAEAAADREDARAFEKNDDLHVAECRGAERAARTIAAAIRAQGG